MLFLLLISTSLTATYYADTISVEATLTAAEAVVAETVSLMNEIAPSGDNDIVRLDYVQSQAMPGQLCYLEATKNTTQVVAAQTEVIYGWVAIQNTCGFTVAADAGTNYFTVPKTGLYSGHLQTTFSHVNPSDTTVGNGHWLALNDATYDTNMARYLPTLTAPAANSYGRQSSGTITMTTGDQVFVFVRTLVGTSVPASTNGEYTLRLSLLFLGT